MACDSRTTIDVEFYTCDDKVERIGDSLVGTCGNVDAIFKFTDWFKKRGDRPEFSSDDNFCAVELNKSGMWMYSNTTFPTKICDPFVAVGTGSMAAKAAMLCECSPAEAVAIAIKCDKNSGGPVRSFTLKVDK